MECLTPPDLASRSSSLRNKAEFLNIHITNDLDKNSFVDTGQISNWRKLKRK